MCKGRRPGLILDRGYNQTMDPGLGRHGHHVRKGTPLTPRSKLALAALSSGESASRPRSLALSATPLFSSGGGSSTDPPCVAVTLLAIPPLACRRPRARPRAPTPFNPPLGGARRSPPLPASAAAAKLYPPLNCYTMSGASAYAFASYSKWQRIPRVQELSR